MKKTYILGLLLLCMMLLCGFTTPKEINRTTKELFPRDNHMVDEAYVHLEKGNAYHLSRNCDTEKILLGIDYKEFTKMSEYEAVYRGFFKCPDCEDLRKIDQYEIETIIEEAIYDTLIELFGS